MAFTITLVNFYQQQSARSRGVRLVVGDFKWTESDSPHYSFTAMIFNEKESYTGFRNIVVKFLDDEGRIIAEDRRQRDPVTGYLTLYMNLPPGQWIGFDVTGELDIASASYRSDLQRDCARVVFSAAFPDGRQGEIDVPLSGQEAEMALSSPSFFIAIEMNFREYIQREVRGKPFYALQ